MLSRVKYQAINKREKKKRKEKGAMNTLNLWSGSCHGVAGAMETALALGIALERRPGRDSGSRGQRGSLCWEGGKRFAEEVSDELGLGEGGVCRLKAEGTARRLVWAEVW